MWGKNIGRIFCIERDAFSQRDYMNILNLERSKMKYHTQTEPRKPTLEPGSEMTGNPGTGGRFGNTEV